MSWLVEHVSKRSNYRLQRSLHILPLLTDCVHGWEKLRAAGFTGGPYLVQYTKPERVSLQLLRLRSSQHDVTLRKPGQARQSGRVACWIILPETHKTCRIEAIASYAVASSLYY